VAVAVVARSRLTLLARLAVLAVRAAVVVAAEASAPTRARADPAASVVLARSSSCAGKTMQNQGK
jgi:hypothetical protein